MYTLTKRPELVTATWAGGTTTQLAIFPATAEYKKFDFDYRISYATVEVDESTFTFMPGVTRHLMILKGALEIDHTDRYKKSLSKFDTDVFSGEWPTTAKGKVMDFNLMTRGNASGKLEAIVLYAGTEKEVPTAQDRAGFYLLKGRLEILQGSERIALDAGDFILFEKGDSNSVRLTAKEDCEVIAAMVQL
jgi:environmental stress-induced protein Ves